MERIKLFKNNKGASLVLVIVAMLFVGLIASIVLTVTVGNSKAARTTISSSENFYSSEGVLDDFKMFLKKYATEAATEAYAKTLEMADVQVDDDVTGETSLDLDGKFNKYFREKLETKLTSLLTDPSVTSLLGVSSRQFSSDFLSNNVTFDRDKIDEFGQLKDEVLNNIGISYDDLYVDSDGFLKMKGVKLSYERLSDGYKSVITTDIVFNVHMPSTGGGTNGQEFTYDIDHFIIVSDGDVRAKDQTANMAGELTGNIYAGNNITVQNGYGVSDGAKPLDIRAQYLIAGNNINVKTGKLSIGPISNQTYDLLMKNGEIYNSYVWCENFKVKDGSVSILNHLKDNSDKLDAETYPGVIHNFVNTNMYISKNLELNGNLAAFESEVSLWESENPATTTGGEIYCYTEPQIEYKKNESGEIVKDEFGNPIIESYATSYDKKAPASSAIILNGLGAKLKLSKLSKLEVAGVAYTGMSTLSGIQNFIDDTDNYADDFYYYTQGESITYRTLQPLYLVPGEAIKSVGHNPMTKEEYNKNVKGKEDKVIEDLLSMAERNIVTKLVYEGSGSSKKVKSGGIKTQFVRYVGTVGSGEDADKKDYVYIFYDFKSVDKAIEYFNTVKNDPSNDKYGKLYKKQADILKNQKGCVELPEQGNCNLKGYALQYTYNGSNGVLSARNKSGSSTFDSYLNEYNCLKAGLKETIPTGSTIDKSKNVVANMFGEGGLAGRLNSGDYAKKLTGPLDPIVISAEENYKYTEKRSDVYKEEAKTGMEYYLVTSNKSSEFVFPDDVSSIVGTGSQCAKQNRSYIIISTSDVKINITNNTYPLRCLIITEGDVIIPNGVNITCLGMVSRQETHTFQGVGTTKEIERISEFGGLLGITYFDEIAEDKATETQKATIYLRRIFGELGKKIKGGSGNGDDFVTINTINWKRN